MKVLRCTSLLFILCASHEAVGGRVLQQVPSIQRGGTPLAAPRPANSSSRDADAPSPRDSPEVKTTIAVPARPTPQYPADGSNARSATAPPSPEPIPINPSGSSNGRQLSPAVIAVITIASTAVFIAVVASAIQLARRRRQRRALLVHRDGPVRKDSSSMASPVLEVGAPRSSSPESGEDSRFNFSSLVTPILQRHKQSVYVPNFVARRLGSPFPSIPKSGKLEASRVTEMQHLGDDAEPMETDADAPQSLPGIGKEECERPSEAMEVEYSESTVHSPGSAEGPVALLWRQERSCSDSDSAEGGSPTGGGASGGSMSLRRLRSAALHAHDGRFEGRSSRETQGSTSACLQSLEIDAAEISIMCRPDGSEWKLGEGAFGSVFKAVRGGVTEVAVKRLNSGAEMDLAAFRQEAAVLASCRDPHVCQFLGACFQPGDVMIVMEFCGGGDLRSRLSSLEGGDLLLWAHGGRRLMLDIAAGLAFLHSRRIIHFDLKSSNVMLSEGNRAKIADVGLASVLSNADYVSQLAHTGTFAYAAPELIMGRKCTPAADMYSFGVLLFEVCTGELPRRGNLRSVRVPEEASSPRVEELINACMEEDPKKRPTAKQAYDIIKAFQ